jgi:hypothetical protein
MNIDVRLNDDEYLIGNGTHLLTIAEDGFSCLGCYASDHDVDDIDTRTFVNKVNTQNESGSLHPIAPISAIPNKYFRELSDIHDADVINEFKEHIKEFLKTNDTVIKSKNLIIDFRIAPAPVPSQYIDALVQALQTYPNSIIDEVIIYQDE